MIDTAYLFQLILWTLLGAGNIGFTVMHFKDKQYFRFGFWTMMSLAAIANLLKLVFCY